MNVAKVARADEDHETHETGDQTGIEPGAEPAPHRGPRRRTEDRRARDERATRGTQLAARERPAVRLEELGRALARHVRDRPVASLVAAVGAGFVVGGALSFRAGRVALAVAVRRLAREVLKQLL
jgi:hypothetical protein